MSRESVDMSSRGEECYLRAGAAEADVVIQNSIAGLRHSQRKPFSERARLVTDALAILGWFRISAAGA